VIGKGPFGAIFPISLLAKSMTQTLQKYYERFFETYQRPDKEWLVEAIVLDFDTRVTTGERKFQKSERTYFLVEPRRVYALIADGKDKKGPI